MKVLPRKVLSTLLAASMLLSVSAANAFAAAPPPPPPGGGSQTFYLSDSLTELESKDYTDIVFPKSTTSAEVAVRAGDGVTADLNGVTITKASGDSSGDDTSFYGINSGLLVYGQNKASHITVSDSTVHTSAGGANGVFAYGKSVVTISDSTVTTTASGASGGIMVAGGGTMYALNLDVSTEGGSSAAIRSDRGSGLMVVDQGRYVANGSKGTGSPAIYCVADITVANATMVAKNAQAICFEGRNPAWIYNCWLEGCYTASDDDENSNVMVYQSMSGDSAEGTSSFTMVGGVLKANNTSPNGNAKMFYTTNTYCYINLCDVEMVYADGMETFLLCACNTNARGWGTAGSNGSECVLYCVEQDVDGDIIYDTWSLLHCYFTDHSVARTALVCREDNGSRGAYVYMDSTSSWVVTGNSLVNDLYTGGGSITDEAGKTVSIQSADGTVYVQGDSAYTITVNGTYSTEDKSDYASVPVIGTEKPEFVYDFDLLGIDTSVYTPVGEDDYVYAPGKTVSVAKIADQFGASDVSEPLSFSDVAETDWFHDVVSTAAAANLMVGSDTGDFFPEGELTWAQALTVAVRAYETINGGIKTVNDNTGRAWYMSYADAGIAYGIISTVPSDPNAAISRADAALMFAAALPSDAPIVNQVPDGHFTDVTADFPSHDAIYALASAGIVNGSGDGTIFGVSGAFQRCHAAAIAARICGLVDKVTISGLEPALPEGGESPAPGEDGTPPEGVPGDIPEGEGGGNGDGTADMIAYTMEGTTLTVTFSGIEMDSYNVTISSNNAAITATPTSISGNGGSSVTVTLTGSGSAILTLMVECTAQGGPNMGRTQSIQVDVAL